MKSRLEQQCRQLSPEDANILCEILLVQRVTDDFFQKINPVEIRQQRRVLKLKQWLLTQSVAHDWQEDIQAISDIGVQNARDLQGNMDRRVVIFTDSETGACSAGTSGYMCISSTPGRQQLSGFAGWISGVAPKLIALYDELK